MKVNFQMFNECIEKVVEDYRLPEEMAENIVATVFSCLKAEPEETPEELAALLAKAYGISE